MRPKLVPPSRRHAGLGVSGTLITPLTLLTNTSHR
jgi:hypothetical protein